MRKVFVGVASALLACGNRRESEGCQKDTCECGEDIVDELLVVEHAVELLEDRIRMRTSRCSSSDRDVATSFPDRQRPVVVIS